MKKLFALLLALVMVLPLVFAACDNGSTVPSGGTQGGDDTQTSKPKDTEAPVDPNAPYVYVPNAEAQYSGMVGIGTSGTPVEISSLNVENREDKVDLYESDFNAADPFEGWTFVGGDKSAFTVTDPVSFKEPAEGGDDTTADTDAATAAPAAESAKVLTLGKDAKGVMGYFGDAQWNYIRFAVKLRLLEEKGDGFSIYFCVKDDKNYKELVIGEDDNKYVSVYEVVDGQKTQVANMLDRLHVADKDNDKYFACTIVFEKDSITTIVNGVEVFHLYAKQEEVKNPLYGGVGLGRWATGVSYDNFVVKSNEDGKVLYENDFENVNSLEDDFTPGSYGVGSWTTMSDWLDEWVIADDDKDHGKVLSMINKTPEDAGIVVTEGLGNTDWTNITIDVDARIDIPNEGWLLIFNAKDVANSAFWNVGGWGNTCTCFQTVDNGTKSGQLNNFESKYAADQWYHFTLVVNEATVYAYIDGYLMSIYEVAE